MGEDSNDGKENEIAIKGTLYEEPPALISFEQNDLDGNKVEGSLFMGSDGKFHFEGDLDVTAKLLFERLKQYLDDYIKEKLENLRKYGRHLRSCELSTQPFISSTNSHWSCTCGFSEAMDCQLCDKKGYVVNLPLPKGGFMTGHCPECGNI